MWPRDKSKTLYLYFHKAYGPPTYPIGDFGWGDSTYKVTWHIDQVVTWQIKNVISPLSQGPWTPHLTTWWLRLRGLHPQIYMILQFCGHVTNEKRYISIFTRPMDPRLSRVVTKDKGTPPTKSDDILTTSSRDKSRTLYLHFHKAYGPHT